MSEEWRRTGVTIKLEHSGQSFHVTYNVEVETGRWFECFYAGGLVAGSDFAHLASDACIAVSKLIEKGATFDDLCKMFGENRLPGADRGPPASVLGMIVAIGAVLTDEWRT